MANLIFFASPKYTSAATFFCSKIQLTAVPENKKNIIQQFQLYFFTTKFTHTVLTRQQQ